MITKEKYLKQLQLEGGNISRNREVQKRDD